MWRSGLTRQRGQTAVAEMVEMAVRTGSFVAPWRSTPQVWDFFRDESELLRHLQAEWRTALACAVYVAIESGHGDLQRDVTEAYRKTLRRHRGVRSILEAHADHPAIAAAMRKERALLSSFAGLVGEAPGGGRVPGPDRLSPAGR